MTSFDATEEASETIVGKRENAGYKIDSASQKIVEKGETGGYRYFLLFA